MLYRQWTDKETCFNMCLRTTIRNGAQFDCRSFEHWHRNCPETASHSQSSSSSSASLDAAGYVNSSISGENSTSPTTTAKTCASFNMYDDDDDVRREKRERFPNKLGYCVLSNQTMKTAGRSFGPNNKVTYYELLCKRKMMLINPY